MSGNEKPKKKKARIFGDLFDSGMINCDSLKITGASFVKSKLLSTIVTRCKHNAHDI